MSGFPTRPNRSTFGPTYEDDKPVVNPKKEFSAALMNLTTWQTAGLGQVVPRAVITGTVSGGAVTTVYQGLAFDPNATISLISFTYVAAGRYSFTFTSTYNDELGIAKSLSLVAGTASAFNTTSLFTGLVNLATAYSGEVRIFNSAGALADPPAFIVQLW
jgi:hypothetical protein